MILKVWNQKISNRQAKKLLEYTYMCTFPHVKHKRVTEIIRNYDVRLIVSYFLIPVMQSIYRNQGT